MTEVLVWLMVWLVAFALVVLAIKVGRWLSR